MDIDKIINEAIDLQINIKKNKKKLDELKNILKDTTIGKNASYKVTTNKGVASFTKRKDRITYTFDENKFLNLDDENKLKLKQDDIIIEKLSYIFDLKKAKTYQNQDLIKSIMKENYKESFFAITLKENEK
tara:strand:+ start:357 stop:749 length:393 start_codon:yes stop_codon:yes gene_type:complete